MAAAVRQNTPVVVTDLMTQTRLVHAQPDGTLRAELSSEIVRVKQGERWVGVDLTLIQRSDGSVGPRAADVELAFSGGGTDQPLVHYGRDGKSLSLSWPGKLPAPVLSGPKATYAEVLPGVDLVMTAQVDGYLQYLVVKTAQAAKNPALARVRFGLKAEGVSVRSDKKTGALEARDDSGEVVFAAPPSLMWDSGTKTAAVGVRVGKNQLTLTPDQKLLTDPKTKFPVTVDPDTRTATRTGWAKVFSGKPDQSYWLGGIDGGEAKVGQCWPSTACNGIGVARTYFQYDTKFLSGKQIVKATLNTTVRHSPSCKRGDLEEKHELRLADRQINSGTTWNNKPTGALVQTRAIPHVYTGCSGYKTVGFDVGTKLRVGGISTYYLKAINTDGYAWRKYSSSATKLVVEYNTRPNAPYEMSTEPRLPAPCKWCDGVPYVGDDWIRLKSRLSDPDGDRLRPIWTVDNGDGTNEQRAPQTYQISGATFSTDVDLRGRHGKTVSWTVRGHDSVTSGPSVNGPGPFVVDQVGVDQKPGVTARLYKEDNRWHGGVGVPDQFTFDAAGVSDIDHYLYGWQDPPSTKVDASALGGPATVTLTPPGDGPRDLYVQSVDRAGHRSPTRVYRFYVRAGNGPYAQWAFEGNTKDSAFLGDRDGTLAGNATYTDGAVGTGLRLDGSGGQMTAPNAVRTDASFSVSAWVKLENDGPSQAVVSQDGTGYSGFYLWYRPTNGGHWAFGMPHSDPDPADFDTARSAQPAQLGVWTHLTGVYDMPGKQLKLYVNGVLSGTQARRSVPWHANGSVRVGQALWNGAATDRWHGVIDEVQLYDRVVTDAEVKAAVSRANVQVGHWKFDDEPGTTAVNAVPGGQMGVLSDGASFTADGAVNGAVQFDGVQGHVTMGAPVLRTDQSFSVAAWVKLGEAGVPRIAVSQDGSRFAGFGLWYRPENGGRWAFGMPRSDVTESGTDIAYSDGPAQIGVWTHLTGVYDASAEQLRLYVDGELAGTYGRTVESWHAAGPFEIGRGMWEGNPALDHWAGAIDEVRAYSRVISAEEIRGVVSQSNVTAGSWRLDGDVADSSGNGRDGTAHGNVSWVGGQSTSPDPGDLALQLDGAGGYASAPHAIDTSKSFSVAAWVRPDKVGNRYTVVSQDGATTSSFKLEVDPGGGWSFTMFTRDVNGGGEAHRAIGGAAQAGVWTHLVGVYDAGNERLLLYINGVLAAGTAHGNAWKHDTGKVQIGRSQWNGSPGYYFAGAIDDVSLYSRPLFSDEIRAMAGRDLSLIHNWAFDESSGTNAADAVGNRPGTLTGGAAFAPGRAGNAVKLNGTDGVVATTGLDMRTDQSFTVASWVYLTAKDCDLNTYWACKVDAVTVEGAHTSKFRLGHVMDDDQSMRGAWTFEMPESDADNAPVTKAVVTTRPSDLDRWVYLVGVYDEPTKKIWLYVDGIRVGDGTLNNPWQAPGGVKIGRGKGEAAGTQYRHWPGSVDDVRLYTGALDKDRVYALYQSYPPERVPDELPAPDAGHWKFDEGAGTTVADISGNGRTATLQGDAGWVGRYDGTAAWLDGEYAHAVTESPVLDTSGSFSVTAWVFLTRSGGNNMTVVGQDGERVSAFQLYYDGANNRWAAVVPHADQNDPEWTTLLSPEAPMINTWTHVGVAYDATLRQLSLYVNGRLAAAKVGVTTWSATGPFSIGRGKWNGGNVWPLSRGVDEVRAFSRALSDAEVRRVYDDGGTPIMDVWRFDDETGRDSTPRQFDLTLSGGTSFTAGVSGKALRLDGVNGSGSTAHPAVDVRESFTVATWAKLSRTDQIATVLGQDGGRMSGFVLQYRPALQRWVFGAPIQDADLAESVYAVSLLPPQVDEWTHLTGVYDYPARQLRLYVDGKLAGTQDNVALWAPTGEFTVGRGKVNGTATHYFPGAIDEVIVYRGALPDDKIAVRGGWAKPAGGQLGRFVNAAGERYTGSTDDPIRDGYHFEATLGVPVPSSRDNTRLLYACRSGADGFTSTDPACEGQTMVGEIGSVYLTPPTNEATIPIYRCANGSDRFDSRQEDCAGATNEALLGYTLAYAPLTLYTYWYEVTDIMSLTDGPPPGYFLNGATGFVSLIEQPDTQQLTSCQAGPYEFPSLDPNCEGETVRGVVGHVWAEPPADQPSVPLYQCQHYNTRYLSTDCGSNSVLGRVGYVFTTVPDPLPEFPDTEPAAG